MILTQHHKTFFTRLLLTGLIVGYLMVPMREPMLSLAHTISHLVSSISFNHSHDAHGAHTHVKRISPSSTQPHALRQDLHSTTKADRDHTHESTHHTHHTHHKKSDHAHKFLEFLSGLFQMDTSQDAPDDFTRQIELDKHFPPDTQHTVHITPSYKKLNGNHTYGFYKNIGLEVLTPPPDSVLL